MLPLGKLLIWEVAIRENTLEKFPLGKKPLGKYLTSCFCIIEFLQNSKKKFKKMTKLN